MACIGEAARARPANARARIRDVCSLCGVLLRALNEDAGSNSQLNVLVVEKDTVPKPDGLGNRNPSPILEHYLDKLERRCRLVGYCSTPREGTLMLANRSVGPRCFDSY